MSIKTTQEQNKQKDQKNIDQAHVDKKIDNHIERPISEYPDSRIKRDYSNPVAIGDHKNIKNDRVEL